jgi:Ca2+-transporting ATPase
VISCNLAEILTIFLAPILGFAIPLLPIHILWINLVTDGLPGLALVAEPAEPDVMSRDPRPPKENLFAEGLIMRIVLSGLVMTVASIAVQWWAVMEGYDVKAQQTIVFTTLCFVQLGNALSVRSSYQNILSPGFFANKAMWGAIAGTVVLQLLIVNVPFLQLVFKTAGLAWDAVATILIATTSSMFCIELIKHFTKAKQHPPL